MDCNGVIFIKKVVLWTVFVFTAPLLPVEGFECRAPKSCAEVLAANPKSTDGNYTMDFNGEKGVIYCKDMGSGSPKEYISLFKANSFGMFQENTTGSVMWDTNTSYSKVRVDIETHHVIATDYTYTEIVNGPDHSGILHTKFGYSYNCKCALPLVHSHAAIVNLRGSGFSFTNQVSWKFIGFSKSFSHYENSTDYQYFKVICGHCCGACELNNSLLRVSPEIGSPVGIDYCEVKRNDEYLGLVKMANDSECLSTNLSTFPLNDIIFDISIKCAVKLIKFPLTGADCGSTTIYGPYVGGIRIVEMFMDNEQPCHTPFISTIKQEGKCIVTVDYNDVNVKSPVHLQMKVVKNQNVVLEFCKKDLQYFCI